LRKPIYESSVLSILEEKYETDKLLSAKCEKGHEFQVFVKKIASKMFNTSSKNFVSLKFLYSKNENKRDKYIK